MGRVFHSFAMINLRSVLRSRPFALLSIVSALLLVAASGAIGQEAPKAANPGGDGLAPILQYISSGWDTLTRSMDSCTTVSDPKMKEIAVVYLPAGMPIPPAVEKLRHECNIQVQYLPSPITRLGEVETSKFHPHGLLYLPNKYVVPGGRFNEMYGWDSYFIIVGLVREGRIDLARGMVENFFFEIQNYGALLNANRTYFLTRSQPPFLTAMVLAVYDAEKQSGRDDQEWLKKAYPYLVKNHEMWVREPHLAGSTGLSRYYDFGDGPPPEGLKDESGFYRQVAAYFMLHPGVANGYIVEKKAGESAPGFGSSYTVQVCDSALTMAHPDCEKPQTVSLSKDYYKGDRAMRESGFDISFRFGPYSAATHHYAPVCLNSLLYRSETDLERISRMLDRKSDADQWKKQAEQRKQAMQKLMWNAEQGLFFDYNFETGQKSDYRYVTTFYPLWAGLATPDQATALAHNLSVFEQPGGLAMSTAASGVQWDYPYGWAPTQLLAVEGLRRYGKNAEADRVAYKFLSDVAENFKRDGVIREKFNVVTRSSETHVESGYQANVVGFGWTNGVFLELLHELPNDLAARLDREQRASSGAPVP